MKKLLFILCIFIISFSISAETYYVETSKGPQPVVVPEGQNSLDVLLKVATAYYEQSWNYNDLLASFKENLQELEILTNKSQEYINENQILREKNEELIQDYERALKDYSKYSKSVPVKGLLGVDATLPRDFKPNSLSINLGALFFEKAGVKTSLNLTKESTFTVSVGAFVLF